MGDYNAARAGSRGQGRERAAYEKCRESVLATVAVAAKRTYDANIKMMSAHNLAWAWNNEMDAESDLLESLMDAIVSGEAGDDSVISGHFGEVKQCLSFGESHITRKRAG